MKPKTSANDRLRAAFTAERDALVRFLSGRHTRSDDIRDLMEELARKLDHEAIEQDGDATSQLYAIIEMICYERWKWQRAADFTIGQGLGEYLFKTYCAAVRASNTKQIACASAARKLCVVVR